MYKYLTLILTILVLISCGNNETNNNEKNNGITIKLEDSENKKDSLKIEPIEINKDNNKIQQIEYNKSEEKLYIGNSVEIVSSIPTNFPKKINIYGENKTYTNSNVDNYLFFISNSNEDIRKISLFYKSLFNKLGYTSIINDLENNNIETPTIENLEFILKNPKYKELLEGEVPSEEKKYLDKVLININSNTPENIKKGMGLKGTFIEIYYNQID